MTGSSTNLPPQIASSNATAASFLSGRQQPSWMTGGPQRPYTRPPPPRPPAIQAEPIQPPSNRYTSPATSNAQSPASLSAPHGNPNPPDAPASTATSTLPMTTARFVPDVGWGASTNQAQRRPSSGGPLPTQPSPAQALPNQAVLPENVPPPGSLDLAALASKIDRLSQSISAANAFPRNMELSRLQLLRNACQQSDYFFLALHQIFCLLPARFSLFSPANLPAIKHAFGILESTMRKNNQMSPDVLAWLQVFPDEFSLLIQPNTSYAIAIARIEPFLVNLSKNFLQLVKVCDDRKYPYTVAEMEEVLGCPSPVLQGIFFTACRRRVGFMDGGLGAELDALFARDQEWHRELSSRPVSAEDRVRWEDWIVTRYRNISAKAFPHQSQPQTQQPPISSPSPLAAPPGFLQLPAIGQQASSRAYAFQDPIAPSHSRQQLQTGQQPYPQQIQALDHGPMSNQQVLLGLHQQQQVQNHPQQLQQQHFLQLQHQHFLLQQQQDQRLLQQRQQLQQQQQQQQQLQQQQHLQQLQHAQFQLQQRQSPLPSILPLPTQPSPLAPRVTLPHQRNPSFGHGPLSTTPLASPGPSPFLPPSNFGFPLSPQHQGPTTPRPNTPRDALLPPKGYTIPLKEWPTQLYDDKSAYMSLHQIRVRSPRRDAKSAERSYQAVKSLAAGPIPILPLEEVQEICFEVTREQLALAAVAKTRIGDLLPTVECHSGSLRWRLRCCKAPKGNWPSGANVGEWLLLEVDWPPSLYMLLNDTHALEMRRRTHNKKDLPVELTDFVTQGINRIKISLPPGTKSADRFFAVEVVEVLSHSHVANLIRNQGVIPEAETLLIVRKRLSGPADDGVLIEAPYISIDLADPFMAKIFSVPVRGVDCTHLECFDLDTWLQTRPAKPGAKCRHGLVTCGCPVPAEPSLPDKWSCPVCSKDARPYGLRIDGFLLSVRRQLEEQGRLNAKSVHVKADGTWTVVVEDDDDENMDDDEPRPLARSAANPSISAVPAATARREVEIIEID